MKTTTVTNRPIMIYIVLGVGLAKVMATEAPPPQTTVTDLAPQLSAVAPVTAGMPGGVVKGTIEEVSAETIYNSLTPHGEWHHLAAFGWCWQPRSWLDELDNGSPVWRSLEYGSWSNFRTLGWCWVPSPRLRMSSYFQEVAGLGENRDLNKGVISSGLGADTFHWQSVIEPGTFWSPIILDYGPTAVGFPFFGLGSSGFNGSYREMSSGFRVAGRGFHSGGFHGGARYGVHAGGRGGFHGGGHFRGGGGFHGGGGVHG